MLLPEIERQQERGKEVVFRADAAFAKPELYEALEERDVKYAIRLPANDHLRRNIAEFLTRPVGRPSCRRGGSTRRECDRLRGAPLDALTVYFSSPSSFSTPLPFSRPRSFSTWRTKLRT